MDHEPQKLSAGSRQPQSEFDDLLTVLSDVSHIKVYEDITSTLKTAAKRLIHCDASSIIIRVDEDCHYIDEDSEQPLWKGMRFPLNNCITGWAILNGSTAIIPDIYDDARVPAELYRHTSIQSMMVAPLKNKNMQGGAISVYWNKRHSPSSAEVHILNTLTDISSLVFDFFILQNELEKAVAARTLALNKANQKLASLAIQDDLTGLYNRRGFFLMADQVLKSLERVEKNCILSFIDIDELKKVNDLYGHLAGDNLIKSVGELLKSNFRKSDIVARLGGDEFAVLVIDPEENCEGIHIRLQSELVKINALLKLPYPIDISMGNIYSKLTATASLEALINKADKLMYKEKKEKKGKIKF